MSYDKYYTPEQMAQLRERREEVGSERIERVQQEWTELFAAYGKAMDAGLDPGHPDVAELARKSAALIAEFTGGDPEIHASLTKMYQSEGPENVMAAQGVDTAPGLWEYMAKAGAALEQGD